MIKELREKIRTDIMEIYGDEWESAIIRIKNYSEMDPFSIELIFAADRYGKKHFERERPFDMDCVPGVRDD